MEKWLHWINFVSKTLTLKFQAWLKLMYGQVKTAWCHLGIHTEKDCHLGVISHRLIRHRPIRAVYKFSHWEIESFTPFSSLYLSFLITPFKWNISNIYLDLHIKAIRGASGDTCKTPTSSLNTSSAIGEVWEFKHIFSQRHIREWENVPILKMQLFLLTFYLCPP